MYHRRNSMVADLAWMMSEKIVKCAIFLARLYAFRMHSQSVIQHRSQHRNKTSPPSHPTNKAHNNFTATIELPPVRFIEAMDSWEEKINIVKEHFAKKGYRIHSGLQLGCELVLYADDPSKVHSDFCIHIVGDGAPILALFVTCYTTIPVGSNIETFTECTQTAC